jgi:hypothetical protein
VLSNLIRWRSNVLPDVDNHCGCCKTGRLFNCVQCDWEVYLGGLLGCRRFGTSGARDLRRTIRAFDEATGFRRSSEVTAKTATGTITS